MTRRATSPSVILLLLIVISVSLQAQPCIYVGDLNFGLLRPGMDTTLSLRICNNGTDTIRFVSPNPHGGPVISWLNDHFSISDADREKLRSALLGPKGSIDPPACISIDVTFSADEVGMYQTTTRLWASTRECRDTSVWRAAVVQPGPQITGYDWQQQWVVQPNACTKNTATQYEAPITVSNDGTTHFTVKSLELIGPDAGAFAFDMTGWPQNTVLPGHMIGPGQANARQQRVIFTPTEERNYVVTIRLTTTEDMIVENILMGVGIESHIDMEDHDFGTILFAGEGATSAEGHITLTAQPTRPTTITGLTISGDGAASYQFAPAPWPTPGFTTMPTPASPWVIVPNTTITIPVIFSPDAISNDAKVAYLEATGDFSECDTAIGLLIGRASASLGVMDETLRGVMVSTDHDGSLLVSLASSASVSLDLHDAAGRHVMRLVGGAMTAGTHRIEIPRDELAAGMYLYRLQSGDVVRSGRIVVVR